MPRYIIALGSSQNPGRKVARALECSGLPGAEAVAKSRLKYARNVRQPGASLDYWQILLRDNASGHYRVLSAGKAEDS